MIGEILAAGKVEDNPMLPVFSEHFFSLRQKDIRSELSQIEKDNFVHFSAAGKDLFSYSKQGTLVPHESKEMFIKFIRYAFGGHPQILKKLSLGNTIPESIRVHPLEARSLRLRSRPT